MKLLPLYSHSVSLIIFALFISNVLSKTYSRRVRTAEGHIHEEFQAVGTVYSQMSKAKRTVWCSPPQFKWKEKGVKLMSDCDIMKPLMKVWVAGTTERHECIKSVYLVIDGQPMPTWQKTSANNQAWIEFENNLQDQTKQKNQPIQVTVTARNPNAGNEKDFSTQFKLDTSVCTQVNTVNPSNVSDGIDDKIDYLVPVAVTSVVLLFLVLGGIILALIHRRAKNQRGPKRGSIDLNDTYGTYARGWDGEGEYGDGDKVYVTDTNRYYVAS